MKHMNMKWMIAAIVVMVTFVAALFSGDELSGNIGNNIKVAYRNITSVEDLRSIDFDCKAVKPMVYEPAVSLDGLPEDEKREAFVKLILPSILIAEYNIKRERERLERIRDKISKRKKLSRRERAFLARLREKYRTDDLEELMTRLNTHPKSIVLAQAALESGWGSSRFFIDGKNVFGIWTFKKDRGIKAANSDARLSRYRSILESAEDYFYNINVGWAYEDFRRMRAVTKDSLKLTNYLDKYSVLRDKYVDRLNYTIKRYNLEVYDSCRIDPDFLS
jgi:Bax protein